MFARQLLAFLLLVLAGPARAGSSVVSLDWSGTDFCVICGAQSYLCVTGTTSRTFADPVPAGNAVTAVAVTTEGSDCAATPVPVSLAGTLVGSFDTVYRCECGTCDTHSVQRTIPTGWPGYTYGGQVALDVAPTASFCLDRATVTIYWDVDTDRDRVPDAADNCPIDANATQADADGDGIGDACDNCPNTPDSTQADTDGDGVGNVCDNCPSASNAGQVDVDGDGDGDACDNCDTTPNANQADVDADGRGDVCDNCPTLANANQSDGDGDGDGDVCDNCPTTPNSNQGDSDSDGNTRPDRR